MSRLPPDAMDRIAMHIHRFVTTVTDSGDAARRPSPALKMAEDRLESDERRVAGALMRVNHAGEVAAQGLYHGQELVARHREVAEKLNSAAQEELDHLRWCRERLRELHTRPSRLDPAWYAGSFFLGAINGLAGDRWNLGFLEATERQVVEHLDDHLTRLPANDHRSRAVLTQMRTEEGTHADSAHHAGALPLPKVVKAAMRAASKVMTRGAYWV